MRMWAALVDLHLDQLDVKRAFVERDWGSGHDEEVLTEDGWIAGSATYAHRNGRGAQTIVIGACS